MRINKNILDMLLSLNDEPYMLQNYNEWFPKLVNWNDFQLDIIGNLHSWEIYYENILVAPRRCGMSYLLRWCSIEYLLYQASKGRQHSVVYFVDIHRNNLNSFKSEVPTWLGKPYRNGTKLDFILNKEYGGGRIIFDYHEHTRLKFDAKATDYGSTIRFDVYEGKKRE